ncbi:MAG: FadR/GntR family transcriptional regulator [Desulfobacterales bacterium]|nr:FadR/GntR family transcriptional regulator [Desulfobacterales bacterium]
MTNQPGYHHPARRTRIHEQITRKLLRQIIRGELAVGAKLPTERTLARTFAVNRATVREALRYLENLELVAVRQGDGAYVRSFLESGNLQIAKDLIQVDRAMRQEVLTALMEVRRNNLPAVAYAAALRRSPAQLQQLEKAALHSPDQTVMARDQQVHRIIARASGNILNVLLINFCEDFFDAFGDLYFGSARHCRRSEAFHRDICEAIAQQNAGHARDIMRDVLQYAETAVGAAVAGRKQRRPPKHGPL